MKFKPREEALDRQPDAYLFIPSNKRAMTMLRANAVDVLVTDVNLPGLSGPEFADRARTLRPDLGIVFATGDTAAVLAEAEAVMLAKPYGADVLVRAVDSAMARRPRSPAASLVIPA